VIPEHGLHKIASYLVSPSAICDHGGSCCLNARAWLRGVDASNSFRDAQWHPPTWLRNEFDWGPIPWPIYWCSLPKMDKLDCGALAALAVEVYRLRGIPVVPVQLALRYPLYAAEQWTRMWEREGLRPDWISGDLVYHEVCGVIEGQNLKLWDPTENRWLEPSLYSNPSFASVVSIKVASSRLQAQAVFYWSGIHVRAGVWESVFFDAEGHPATSCTRPDS